MKRRSLALSTLTALLLSTACSKPAEAPAEGAAKKDDKAAAETDAAKTDGAKSGDKANAAGDAVVAGDTVSECPKSLGGKDEVSRVIKKECGEVHVTDTYEIEGTLTLEAGARLAFADGAKLEVGQWNPGKLIVAGTKDDPVVFTAKGDKAAGVWGGIRLSDKAARSKIEHLVVEFAGASETPAVTIDAPDVTVDGLVVRDAKHIGLHVTDVPGLALTSPTFQRGPERVAEVHPNALGGVGPGTYDPNMKIRVLDGKISREATWQDHGAPLVLTGEIEVEGKDGAQTKLTIAAGSELRFEAEGRIVVGKWDPAKVVVTGTAEAPVKFTNLADAAGAPWASIAIRNHGELELTGAHLAFAGKDDEGAVLVDREGKAKIVASKIVDSVQGVITRADDATLSIEGTTFERVPTPFVLHPNVVAGLLSGNVYDATATGRVEEGKVAKDATWTLQALPLVFAGEITVEKAKLALPAGFVGRFERGAKIVVGTWDASEFTAIGTAEAPILLEGAVDEPSVWGPIAINSKTTKAELVHVRVKGTSGEAAIEVARDAIVTLDHVTGAKLEGAIVKSDCGSKLTATNLVAEEGTPKTTIDPEGC
jgi:hypothetical protein